MSFIHTVILRIFQRGVIILGILRLELNKPLATEYSLVSQLI